MSRWVRELLVLPIRGYRRWVGPLKPGPTCRFQPTCSEYAMDALRKRGVLVGLSLGIWRILRCQPLCKPGYDPVPEKRQLRAKAGVD